MTRVTVRELQQNIRRVLGRVERGEMIEVTRRRRPIARLPRSILLRRLPHGLISICAPGRCSARG
jgi:hypothetical protein